MFYSRIIRSFLAAREALGRSLEERAKLEYMTHGTHFRSGALKPNPQHMPFGVRLVSCAVLSGLFLGAGLSKIVANFLEENNFFVPFEDDYDDD